MCKRSRSASPPPVPPPQQKQREEAAAGVMASRRALKSGVVRRYSTGERRERIERYRSKRNSRNFQKKITYACRKTLAEKRNRVRGRFAHTGDDDKPSLPENTNRTPSSSSGDEKPCLPENTNPTPSSSTGSAVPEWWPAMEEAMAREEEEDSIINLLHWDDCEVLASYLGYDLSSTADPSTHPST